MGRNGDDGGPAGEPRIRRGRTKPRRSFSSACVCEGPGDLQGFATPAAANLDCKNDEAAAAGPGELRVATTFALEGIVCCTAWGGIGPGVGFPSACDGADAGGVDGQLLAMIQAEPVGDYLEAAAISDGCVEVHVGQGNIAGDAAASLAANSGNGDFESRPSGGEMA